MTLNSHYALCLKIHEFSEPTAKIWMKIDLRYQQRRCSPMTLVSGNIWFMQIFTGVPWTLGVKRQWGCPKRQVSVLLVAIYSEALEARPTLLYSIIYSVAFPPTPQYVTLNDLQWPFYVKFCFFCQFKFKICLFTYMDSAIIPMEKYISVCSKFATCFGGWKYRL